MTENCYITETARGFALHCADGTVIDGQATYADAARLARRSCLTVVPPPAVKPVFHHAGTAGEVATKLHQFCQAHGLV